MKTQVLQEDLSKALTLASRFVSSRAQLPVLANILLQAQKTKLLISATNLEISISTSIGAKTEKEGEITLPARTMTDLIANLNKETLSLEAKKEQLHLSSASFKGRVAGMNSTDFPAIPQVVGQGAIKLGEDFLEALPQVLISTSIDETRPVLTGVLMLFQKTKLALVATDGFRLSQKVVNLGKAIKVEKLILPRPALSELTRMTDGEELSLNYREKDNQVVFGLGNTILGTRVIEGDFPDYKKIIPQASKTTVNLDKEDFLRAIKTAAVFAREAANIVKLNVKKDHLEVGAESQRSGKQTIQVEAKIEGDELSIAYNYRFIEEFLNVIKGGEVEIGLIDTTSPGIFRDTKDKNLLHLIMPVRVQD